MRIDVLAKKERKKKNEDRCKDETGKYNAFFSEKIMHSLGSWYITLLFFHAQFIFVQFCF